MIECTLSSLIFTPKYDWMWRPTSYHMKLPFLKQYTLQHLWLRPPSKIVKRSLVAFPNSAFVCMTKELDLVVLFSVSSLFIYYVYSYEVQLTTNNTKAMHIKWRVTSKFLVLPEMIWKRNKIINDKLQVFLYNYNKVVQMTLFRVISWTIKLWFHESPQSYWQFWHVKVYVYIR